MDMIMNPHMNMHRIFRLLSNELPTGSYMQGCLTPEKRQQKKYVLATNYHSILGQDRSCMSWQRPEHDDDHELAPDSVSRCSSAVALSLSAVQWLN